MKTYRSFARALEQLLDGETAVRIRVEAYMPLVIEEIGPNQVPIRYANGCRGFMFIHRLQPDSGPGE